jgi:leucyl aminopeptidase
MTTLRRAVVLVTLAAIRAAAATFPTWTQDAPNVQALTPTPLAVNVHVVAAAATNRTRTWREHDLVLLSYEGANETTTTTTSLPLDGLDDLLASQANASTAVGTASPAALFLGNQTMLRTIRTHCTQGATDARILGRRVAALVTAEPASPESTLVVLCGATTNTNLTTVTHWSEWAAAFYNGFYQEERYRGTRVEAFKPVVVPQVTLVVDDDDDDDKVTVAVIQQGLRRGRILAESIATSRDIVNAPHNVLNSFSLAATAVALARQHRSVLSCRILNAPDCVRLGMGAFLGVARGSETTAKFIHLTYTPRRRVDRTKPMRRLGIVGKGLLFDTGGTLVSFVSLVHECRESRVFCVCVCVFVHHISFHASLHSPLSLFRYDDSPQLPYPPGYNIKTGMGMTNMKFDCGGAAAVLGAAHAIASLEPAHVEVHFLIAACENMVNERAMVPGDVLVASNGKTIEVLNTDAEGRLTMADALVYADQTLQCEEILELSTLTGACMMALGSAVAGLFTHDDDMAQAVLSAAETCGNKVWRMPMEKEYAEDIKSKVADIKNIGGRFGGAITAALFLQHFVEDAKFAHVDLAGPVWDYKAGQASGWGARLVTDWVLASQPTLL